uniref:Uncharacterized protein n=1 Tax=Cacopsylla melanoneura TaxID=428564 RepID=A0A8D9AXI5_9HEMI
MATAQGSTQRTKSSLQPTCEKIQEAAYVACTDHADCEDPANCDNLEHRPDEILRVKTGNNSLVTTDITPELLVDDDHTSVGPPTFFQSLSKLLYGESECVFVPDIGYQLVSQITRNEHGGFPGSPRTTIASTVIAINPTPIPDSPARHDLEVIASFGKVREKLNMEPYQKLNFPNSTVKDYEIVYNYIRHDTELSIQDESRTFFAMANMFDGSFMVVYDNSMIYAKLFYYVYLLTILEEMKVVPNVAPHQPENDPKWLNFNIPYAPEDQGHYSPEDIALADSIEGSFFQRIVLLHNKDIFDYNMDSLRFLTDEGNKVLNPDSGPVPHILYIKWPAIPVTILANQPRPAHNDAKLVNPSQLISFARILASKRGEWPCLVKGAYIATELMGTRFKMAPVPDGAPEGELPHWWPLRSNLSPQSVFLPAPFDYNFPNRVVGLYPASSNENQGEGDAFSTLCTHHSHLFPSNLVRAAVLYNAVLSSATSTFLHGVNINTAILKSWGTNKDLPEKLYWFVLNNFTNISSPNNPIKECKILSVPRKAFKLWLGVGVCEELYPLPPIFSWWGAHGEVKHADVLLQDLDDNIIPHLFNPLCLDNYIRVRPLEWALLGRETTLDLRGNILWARSCQGLDAFSNIYALRACSQEPYKLVVFGAQIIQVIMNAYRTTPERIPPISVQTIASFRADHLTTDNPVKAPIPAAQFNEALNNFNPFTFRSYSWTKDRVLFPALVGWTEEHNPRHTFLSLIQGQQIENVGMVLRRTRNNYYPELNHLMGRLHQ